MEIPTKLHSYDHGTFKNCIICNRDLIKPDEQYIIEKAIRRYPGYNTEEIIYEYAMCLPCAMEQKKALSEKSMNSIQEYMSKFGNFFSSSEEADKGGMDTCSLFGTKVSEMDEYMVQGLCIGSRLMPNSKPIVIGQKAMEQISELLSEKTRGEMDDFIDTHFGGPPELKAILKGVKVYI